MTIVRFHDRVDDALLKYAVILARTGGRWVFCKHRDRETWEIPGGHREKGEAIDETARRELYEETGAIDFRLTSVCAYSVADAEGPMTYGMLYRAEIFAFEPELHSEIERIRISDRLPEAWTYPLIQPKLIEEAERRSARQKEANHDH